jgi:hypothetical protein
MRAFGVAGAYRKYRDVAGRSAFIVDTDGVVRFARRYAEDEIPDFDELDTAARAVQ